MVRQLFRRLGLRAIVGLVLVTSMALFLTSCALFRAGTLNPGGGVISTAPAAPDGRGVAFGAVLINTSNTDQISLDSVDLYGVRGVELAEADTTTMDKPVGIGAWIPPLLNDKGVDNSESIANWAQRTALDQSVMEPQGYLWLVLVLQATSTEDCVYADGFIVRYHEYGHKYSTKFEIGMVIGRSGFDVMTACQDTIDAISARHN